MTREKRAVRKGESEQVGGMNFLFMLEERAIAVPSQLGRVSEREK